MKGPKSWFVITRVGFVVPREFCKEFVRQNPWDQTFTSLNLGSSLYPGFVISRVRYIPGSLYPGFVISRVRYIPGSLYPGFVISEFHCTFCMLKRSGLCHAKYQKQLSVFHIFCFGFP